jgi:hypothetical protein
VAGFCGHGDEHAFENKGLKKTLVGHTTDSCKKEDTTIVLGHITYALLLLFLRGEI